MLLFVELCIACTPAPQTRTHAYIHIYTYRHTNVGNQFFRIPFETLTRRAFCEKYHNLMWNNMVLGSNNMSNNLFKMIKLETGWNVNIVNTVHTWTSCIQLQHMYLFSLQSLLDLILLNYLVSSFDCIDRVIYLNRFQFLSLFTKYIMDCKGNTKM